MSNHKLSLTLPWPPSVNYYWRKNGRAVYLTEDAKEFRAEVYACVHPVMFQLEGRLRVAIDLQPGNRMKRDIDNYAKSTIDALMHAGVFEDDEQIDELLIRRLPVVPREGAAFVTIEEIQG